jgi:endonuclease/exonuclease/phosphatase family metal-dependent hydrolase
MILCGDLNSFPYGYSYQKIKKYLNNSFEESGLGLGFTLNIPPYCIRLDNQFHSPYFHSLEAEVIKDIDHSDHFPLQCVYGFK